MFVTRLSMHGIRKSKHKRVKTYSLWFFFLVVGPICVFVCALTFAYMKIDRFDRRITFYIGAKLFIKRESTSRYN